MYVFTVYFRGLMERVDEMNMQILQIQSNVKKHIMRTHVQYCQSDTGRESYSRPDKLLRTVNILYDPSLFVSAVGGRVKRLLNLQHMPTVRTVRTIRTDREPIHDPTNCYGP